MNLFDLLWSGCIGNLINHWSLWMNMRKMSTHFKCHAHAHIEPECCAYFGSRWGWAINSQNNQSKLGHQFRIPCRRFVGVIQIDHWDLTAYCSISRYFHHGPISSMYLVVVRPKKIINRLPKHIWLYPFITVLSTIFEMMGTDIITIPTHKSLYN